MSHLDLSEVTHQPIPITLAGQSYQIQPRTLAQLGPLQAWFKRMIPSPLVRAGEAIAQARRLGVEMTPGVERLMLDQAQQKQLAWPPTVGSWAWFDAVDRADLGAEVIRFALAPLHPEIDLEAAQRLLRDAEEGELAILACVLIEGRLPAPKELRIGPTTPKTPSLDETTPAKSAPTSP